MTVALARSTDDLEDRWDGGRRLALHDRDAGAGAPADPTALARRAAGLNTGGYISGYRGSPLGRYDIELWRAEAILKQHNIVFRPASTRISPRPRSGGAQQLTNFPGATVDGVFGIWYGQGARRRPLRRRPSATRISPAPRSKGGAIALAGDDHGAKSSTAANFSDTSFVAVGMPVLYPSNTQELLDYGLHGIAMSRFFRLLGRHENRDPTSPKAEARSMSPPDSPAIVMPERPSNVPGGLGPRVFEMPIPQEERLYDHKLPAALDLCARQPPQPDRQRSAEHARRRRGRRQGLAGSVCRRSDISASPTMARRSA